MTESSLFAAITPASINPHVIMFLRPDQAAATNLADSITRQMVHDIYESLPAGAVSESDVDKLFAHIKTYLLTGQGLSTSFGALAGLITASTAPPSSAAAGKQLADLITGSMVKDIIVLVAPTISADQVKSSIDLLKTDLRSGLGFEPWLQSMASTFGGLIPSTAHQA